MCDFEIQMQTRNEYFSMTYFLYSCWYYNDYLSTIYFLPTTDISKDFDIYSFYFMDKFQKVVLQEIIYEEI